MFSKIVAAAYLIPLQNIGAAVRAFWPTLLLALTPFLLLLVFDASSEITPQDGAVWFVVVLSLGIYWAFLTAKGAVQWHRHLILGEPIGWTSLVPNATDLRYVLWTIAVGILTLIVLFGIGLVLIPIILSVGSAQDATGPVSTDGNILTALIVNALASVIVIFLLASFIIKLPSVAVASHDDEAASISTVRKVLLMTALPLALVSTLLSHLLIPYSANPLVSVGLTIFNWYVSLVALSGLSLAYRWKDTTV